jgi:excisionase family DNA binding protein
MQAQQTEKSERGLATVREAASYLGLSVARVYTLMASGELGHVKIGRSRRIAWPALDELIRRCTVAGEFSKNN